MAIKVRKKVIRECDGGAGAPAYSSAATNINGMGNPIPAGPDTIGSGDNFGNTLPIAVKKQVKYKIRKKK